MPRRLVRALMCILGVSVIGIGSGLLRYGAFGIDPWGSLTNGLWISLLGPRGLSFGSSFFLLCCVFLLVPLFFDRSKIGFGTLVNMVLTGYVSDFILSLLVKIPLTGTALSAARIFSIVLSVVVICFGSGVYLNTNTGASPYDALGLIIAEKLKKPALYRWVRIGTDILCTVLGFLMGSAPGMGTLIMAFFTGPLISIFRLRIMVWGKRAGLMVSKTNSS